MLEAAAKQLSSRGLDGNLLEQAAAAAGCSPDRARTFFGRDEEVVLALYARFAADLEARVLELPQGTTAERFRAAMTMKFAIVKRYRESLAALMAALLDPRHELGALSPHTEIIRNRVLGVFAAVVQGASDCPPLAADRLIRLLYGAHLALMLIWSQDRAPETPAAQGALELFSNMLGIVTPILATPGAALASDQIDGVLRLLFDPRDDDPVRQQATAVLRCLFRHRRLLATPGECTGPDCETCLALHLPRVTYFLRVQQPLHFLLPAFPAKSPSRRKTLGRLPDQAEECALLYLEAACGELRALHAPGVRVTICSDGHVFSDLVGVSDHDVNEYGREIEALIRRLECRSLDTFSMANLYEGIDFEAMRRHLIQEYAVPLEQVQERARRFEHARTLLNGIHRFLFEEQADVQPHLSRTQVRNACRSLAYQVVQRSDAWGRLLADCFPTALRLSIHPQHPHSEKIGILLGDADDAWLTPWHAAALRTADGWKFIPAAEAVARGARLVERDGRPSHFELS